MFKFVKYLLIRIWRDTVDFFRTFWWNLKYTRYHVSDVLDFIFGKEVNLLSYDIEKEAAHYTRVWRSYVRTKIFKLIAMPRLFSIDRLEVYITFYNRITNIFSLKKANKIQNLPRYYYRVKHFNFKPYTQNYTNYVWSDFYKQTKAHFLYGIISLWNVLRKWVLSLILGLVSVYFLSAVRLLPVNVTLFQWFTLLMFTYWLLSGFVFFVKKYQYSRYTSAIQRFWRRSYILFWLIESCLLVVFFYLTLNASQETPFMLDQIQIFKTHLFSWRSFLPRLFLVSMVVIFGYLLLLNIKWNIFKKNISLILIITVLLTYLLWVEFYQIYHIANFYANFFWSYDVDEKLWSLEFDARRTRIVNHYMMILFILKFWHIVFIYGFWIFFVLRANELNRARYPLYSANFQNFIILYIMSWLFMYPWIKTTLHRFIEVPYFWFYVNNRELGLRVFFNDIKLVFYGIESLIFVKNPIGYSMYDFYYWMPSSNSTGFYAFRKHWIRDIIVKELYRL